MVFSMTSAYNTFSTENHFLNISDHMSRFQTPKTHFRSSYAYFCSSSIYTTDMSFSASCWTFRNQNQIADELTLHKCPSFDSLVTLFSVDRFFLFISAISLSKIFYVYLINVTLSLGPLNFKQNMILSTSFFMSGELRKWFSSLNNFRVDARLLT